MRAGRTPHLLDDVGADADVVGVVDGGDPEAEDVRAIRGLRLEVLAPVDHAQGVDRVANGLGHLGPLLVEHKAVCEDRFVGRDTVRRDRRQQGALEPPPARAQCLFQSVTASRVVTLGRP